MAVTNTLIFKGERIRRPSCSTPTETPSG